MRQFIEEKLIYKRLFEVDGLKYQFSVTTDFEIMFSLMFGKLPDGRHFPEYDPFERWNSEQLGTTSSINGIPKPIKVFRYAFKELDLFLVTFRPKFFYFRTVENSRIELYMQLSGLISEKTRYFLTSGNKDGFYFALKQIPTFTT